MPISSPELETFLRELRAHPLWASLVKSVQAPRLPRFRRSQAAEVEKARAEWIYESGRRDMYDYFVTMLLGELDDDRDEDGNRG